CARSWGCTDSPTRTDHSTHKCRVREGPRGPSLPSEPCVRVGPAHGSSKPRTTLKHRSSAIPSLRRGQLLVTVQVYQDQVAVLVRPALPFRPQVVPLKLLTVDEKHPAHRADPVLRLGHLHVTEGQVADIYPPPFPPVFPKIRVVGGGGTADQDVALDREPAELQQVTPGALVAKHPRVVRLRVQPSPVAVDAPSLRLTRVITSDVAHGPAEHPVVELLEHLGRHRRAEVIGPTPDQGVEAPQHLLNGLPTQAQPSV